MAYAVYVIVADSGEVKVGVSGTPYARLSKIKREYGAGRGFTDARLVGFVLTGYPMHVEHFAIQRLLPHATGGEWFHVEPMRALVTVLQEAREIEPSAAICWPHPPGRTPLRSPAAPAADRRTSAVPWPSARVVRTASPPSAR